MDGYVPEQPEETLSFEYLNAAYDIECKTPLQKFVLVTLANHANSAGECFPSLNTIAKRCGMDRGTVIRHLATLQEMGLIFVDRRAYQSNIYRLCFEPVVPCNKVVAPCNHPSSTVPPKPLLTSNNHQKKPRLHPAELVSLEKRRDRYEKELDELNHDKHPTKEDRERRKWLRAEIPKIDQATHIEL